MKILKIIGWGLLFALIIIQFFPIDKNVAQDPDPSDDFATLYDVPPNVQETLKVSCYDCHSNTTTYLWYDKIQPAAWYIQSHVDEGKDELNFDEFGKYSAKRKSHKIDKIAEEVEEGHMPLSTYTFMHTDSRLTDAQREELVSWFKGLAEQQ